MDGEEKGDDSEELDGEGRDGEEEREETVESVTVEITGL